VAKGQSLKRKLVISRSKSNVISQLSYVLMIELRWDETNWLGNQGSRTGRTSSRWEGTWQHPQTRPPAPFKLSQTIKIALHNTWGRVTTPWQAERQTGQISSPDSWLISKQVGAEWNGGNKFCIWSGKHLRTHYVSDCLPTDCSNFRPIKISLEFRSGL